MKGSVVRGQGTEQGKQTVQNRSDKPEPTTPCRPLVIGLTGGIGSGKSSVAAYFSELGVPVIDTDIIARQLVEPGQPGLRQIITCFGKQILNPDGTLDRAQLRSKIFSAPAERLKLEQILHPLIRAEMQRQIQQADTHYCIVEIPLLLESGWRDEVDRVLVVDAPPTLQIERATQRSSIDREEVERIIATQTERSKRIAAADDVILNEGSLADLKQQVARLHQLYQKETGQ